MPFSEYFFGEQKLAEFSEILVRNGYSKGINGFFNECLFFGLAGFALALATGLWLKADNLHLVLFCLFGLILPPIAIYFFLVWGFEARKSELERNLPDFLLQASIFPVGTSLEQIIEASCKANSGELYRELELVLSDLKIGTNLEDCLKRIGKRNNSRSLNRVINLLIQAQRSGANINSLLRETAEELLENSSLLRERIAGLAIEKYTLLFAGGIIVPVILGLLVGMISGLNFSSLQELGLGISETMRNELIKTALIANQAYIAEYALLASLFVANQENNLKKAVIYASILLPLSLGIYNGIQLLKII